VFSPDGKHIAFSARHKGGKYTLEVADFVETPEPHLENSASFQPGGGSYYEPGADLKTPRPAPLRPGASLQHHGNGVTGWIRSGDLCFHNLEQTGPANPPKLVIGP
jgi:hypothetical protein